MAALCVSFCTCTLVVLIDPLGASASSEETWSQYTMSVLWHLPKQNSIAHAIVVWEYCSRLRKALGKNNKCMLTTGRPFEFQLGVGQVSSATTCAVSHFCHFDPQL